MNQITTSFVQENFPEFTSKMTLFPNSNELWIQEKTTTQPVQSVVTKLNTLQSCRPTNDELRKEIQTLQRDKGELQFQLYETKKIMKQNMKHKLYQIQQISEQQLTSKQEMISSLQRNKKKMKMKLEKLQKDANGEQASKQELVSNVLEMCSKQELISISLKSEYDKLSSEFKLIQKREKSLESRLQNEITTNSKVQSSTKQQNEQLQQQLTDTLSVIDQLNSNGDGLRKQIEALQRDKSELERIQQESEREVQSKQELISEYKSNLQRIQKDHTSLQSQYKALSTECERAQKHEKSLESQLETEITTNSKVHNSTKQHIERLQQELSGTASVMNKMKSNDNEIREEIKSLLRHKKDLELQIWKMAKVKVETNQKLARIQEESARELDSKQEIMSNLQRNKEEMRQKLERLQQESERKAQFQKGLISNLQQIKNDYTSLQSEYERTQNQEKALESQLENEIATNLKLNKSTMEQVQRLQQGLNEKLLVITKLENQLKEAHDVTVESKGKALAANLQSDQMSAKMDELKCEADRMNEQNFDLQKQVDEMTQEADKLKHEANLVVQVKANLQKQIEKQKQENLFLKTKIDETDRIKIENERLKLKNIELNETVENVQDINNKASALEDECEKLRVQNQQLQKLVDVVSMTITDVFQKRRVDETNRIDITTSPAQHINTPKSQNAHHSKVLGKSETAPRPKKRQVIERPNVATCFQQKVTNTEPYRASDTKQSEAEMLRTKIAEMERLYNDRRERSTAEMSEKEETYLAAIEELKQRLVKVNQTITTKQIKQQTSQNSAANEIVESRNDGQNQNPYIPEPHGESLMSGMVDISDYNQGNGHCHEQSNEEVLLLRQQLLSLQQELQDTKANKHHQDINRDEHHPVHKSKVSAVIQKMYPEQYDKFKQEWKRIRDPNRIKKAELKHKQAKLQAQFEQKIQTQFVNMEDGPICEMNQMMDVLGSRMITYGPEQLIEWINDPKNKRHYLASALSRYTAVIQRNKVTGKELMTWTPDELGQCMEVLPSDAAFADSVARFQSRCRA